MSTSPSIRRRMSLAVLVSVCSGVVAVAQAEIAPLVPLLDDPDRDEAREVAARYLVAVPDSPSLALRAFCRGTDWRRRALLLRVLGERGELRAEDVAAALASNRWTVRAAAIRALGNSPHVEGFQAELERTLVDPWASVRRESLLALARRDALTDLTLSRALADVRLRAIAVSLVARRPRSYEETLVTMLASKPSRDALLLRLPGVELGARGRDAVRALAASDRVSAATRCAAMLALPRVDWPVDSVALLLQALASERSDDDGVARFGAILRPAECARLLDGLASETSSRLMRARLRFGRRAPPGSGVSVLRAIDRIPKAELEQVLRCLAALETPGLVAQCRLVLETREDVDIVLPWLRQVGSVLAEDAAGRRLLSKLLQGARPRVARAAFHVLVTQRKIDDALLAFAVSDARYARTRTGRLLGAVRHVPRRFWLTLLQSADPRQRWTAAKALATHSSKADVHQALLRTFYEEKDFAARRALLSSLLKGIDPKVVPGVVAWIVAREDRVLDKALIEQLENSSGTWVRAALRQLSGTRFASHLVAIRAMRGDPGAAREILADPNRVSTAKLRRMRDSIAAVLRADDLVHLEGLLFKQDDNAAMPWVQEEIVAWLRQRSDLASVTLLERVFRSEVEPEVREAAAGALVARGRTELLMPLVDSWVRVANEDAEGMLLEVVAALPKELDANLTRFLVRLLVAPVLRDPLDGVAHEMRTPTFRGRVDALFPLLRATIEALGRADPETFRDLLIKELRVPEVRRAWTCASKSYLLRGLQLAVHYEGSERVLEPVLDWALRLGPRPHPADGALFMLAARARQRAGELAEAARFVQRGLDELAFSRLPPRAIEQIARDLVPDSTGPGFPVLAAQACLLEAGAKAVSGQIATALGLARRARLAARGDAFLLRAIDAFVARQKRVVPSQGRRGKR